ncbi:MAG: alternate-type signal peptide domain-containing protein [Nocardioides alkalitolerans]|jgi:alternate signal-mediated exported protein
MQKITKGAIAAGGAAVLLLGGAGSLAFWNATADVPGGAVDSGELTLTPVAAGQWTFNGDPIADPGAVTLVPGDELAYSGTYTIGAEGDNLEADVAVTGGAAAGSLAPYLTTSLDYTVDGADDVDAITEANDGDVLAVDLAISFPFGTTADNASQQQTLDLGAVSIALTQTDATP